MASVEYYWCMCIEMKEEINFVEGTTAKVEGMEVVIEGPKGELRKKLSYPGIRISIEGDKIVVEGGERRSHKKMINTFVAHIKNLMKGVTEGFEYKMKICFIHFPISLKKQGSTLVIENFMGEKKPRTTRLLQGVDVDIKGSEITLQGIDKEKVSQTAANIEQACRVKRRDRRVFQDGIYIVSKGGKV